MIYCQTINKECIAVHPLDDINNTLYVEMVKYGSEPKFAVLVEDYDWIWEFDMTCPTDYEKVKMSIFDAIFVCDTTDELVDALGAIFENDFEDILIDDECDCCGCCDDCEFAH